MEPYILPKYQPDPIIKNVAPTVYVPPRNDSYAPNMNREFNIADAIAIFVWPEYK